MLALEFTETLPSDMAFVIKDKNKIPLVVTKDWDYAQHIDRMQIFNKIKGDDTIHLYDEIYRGVFRHNSNCCSNK